MTDQFKSVTVIVTAALLIQACGMFKDKPEEYLLAEEGSSLDIPEGLDQPRLVSPVLIGVKPMQPPSGDELNPLPPRAAITAGGGQANAYLAWSAAGAFLSVKDNPESVDERLRTAIESSGMSMVQADEQGRLKFEYHHEPAPVEKSFFEKMMFWRSNEGPDYSGTYQVHLEPDGNETRVYLLNTAGEAAFTNVAEHVLGIFMERLG